MALSGTFSNKWKGYTYQISWSATQSAANNTSTITCVHRLICDSTWALYIDGRTITCTVNSVSKTVSASAVSTGGGSTINLGTTTHTVTHASNGTGSFSLSSVYPIQATIQGTYQASISVSGSATLNTIPRSSSMTFPEFTMGSASTMTISGVSGFTHTITYAFGNKSGTIVTKTSNTSVSWTPPLNDLAGQIPNSTRGAGTLTLITYSGNTEIGRRNYTFYCNVPSSVVPTVGTITLTPDTINGNKILVQNKNKLTISVAGSSAGTGSTIKSYTFTGAGISTTTTSSTAVINSVSSSGTLTYTVNVTDSRGRTASKTSTVTCYGYNVPSFSTFEISRDSSNNIKCNYKVSYSSVNNTNKITVKFYYKKASSSSWTAVTTTLADAEKTGYTILSNASDEVYNAYATVTDSYGASISSSTQTVFGSARIINVPQGGNGVSIGRKSTITSTTAAGKFEVGWDATFDKDINIGENATVNGNATIKGTAAITGNVTMSGILTTTGAVNIKNNINMGGLNGQTGELQIKFSNPETSTNPHNSYLYGGNPKSTTAIGCYDGKYGRTIWSYNDTNNTISFGNGSTKIYFNGNGLSNLIIEDGSQGDWQYRKWSNGRAECWRVVSVNPTNLNNGVNTISMDLPFTFAGSDYSIQITPAKTGHYISGVGDCNASGSVTHSNTSFTICYRYNYSTAYTVSFNITINGRWK